MAREHEVVVFPATPLSIKASYALRGDAKHTNTTLPTCKTGYQRMYAPVWLRDAPQKIHFSDFWSRMFCRVGSRTSSAILNPR